MPNTARLIEPDTSVLETSFDDDFRRVLTSEDVRIRLASNKDGKKIKELVTSAGFNIDIPFDDIYPFWLVAEYQNEIVGCLQVCVGKPIGRLEMLATKKPLPHKIKTITVLHLMATGTNTLKESGVTMVSSMVSFKMKSFKRILQRYGGFTLTTGNLMGKKL